MNNTLKDKKSTYLSMDLNHHYGPPVVVPDIFSDDKCSKCNTFFCKVSPNQLIESGIVSENFMKRRNDHYEEKRKKYEEHQENQNYAVTDYSDDAMIMYAGGHDIADQFECLHCNKLLCRDCVCELDTKFLVPSIESMKYYDYCYEYYGGIIECIQGQDIPITCPFCNLVNHKSYPMGYDHEESVKWFELLNEIKNTKK